MDPNTLNPADVWNLIVANPFSAVVFLLLVISEALASVKSIQGNSIFQVVYGLLKKLGPAPKPPVVMLLLAGSLLVSGCTSVHELGNGKVLVPRLAEVRSPFGTNAGFAKLELCEKAPREARWSEPFADSTEYVRCQQATEWVSVTSQGQGGQIVSGLLNAGALVGVGALLPTSSSSAVQSQSVVTSPPARGHH